MKLTDGTFLVVKGWFGDENVNDVRKLYILPTAVVVLEADSDGDACLHLRGDLQVYTVAPFAKVHDALRALLGEAS